MELDPLILSRLQFAWVIAWHILLPAFTVGLASYIAVLEGLSFFTGRDIYLRISAFWIKIFSVSFGMGVVSGIVMPFQFGTNWSRYSDATANVLSPLFAYEGLTAFFLEAAFLGVLLFGRTLVPRWAHFVAALMVAFGTLLSSFWILSANSWMQTPAGYELVDGRFFPKNWLEIIFNPSFPYRLGHTVVGFYVTTAFVVVGVAAWLIRRGRFVAEGSRMLSMTLWLLTVLVPLQILLGDMHGLNTLHYQPAKLAAIEAHWDTESRAPLNLFAIPDEQNETNHYVIQVPLLGSLILAHDVNGEIKGLKDFPRDQRPPVAIPFFSFRIMVGIGVLMLAIVATSWWLRWKGTLFTSTWYLRACQLVAPLGFVAVVAGWTTTEVGRQPWTVYGLLRTADSVSPSLTGADVLISFAGYMIAYLVIFPAGLYIMARFVRKGPDEADDEIEEMADIVSRTLGRGGTVVIPAFAVGRAQSLLYHLWKLKTAGRLSNIPVYLDSPMAINATDLLHAHRKDHRLIPEICDAICKIATYTREVEESKAITASRYPKVVISASGMATGGRVLHHLKVFAPDPKNTVLFSGFQAAGTRGRAMLQGAKEINVHGEWIPVRAGVEDLGPLSAHADANELMRWLTGFRRKPTQTFIVHGEDEAAEALRVRIGRELSWNASVPRQEQVFDL